MGSDRRTVLVIDDDASVCAFVSKALTGRGIDVFTASNPQDGVRLADAESPDLIFISLLLSNSNGLKVSKAIHAIDRLRAVPVVMLISYAGELDAKYTASIGVIDVFVKPLNEADFVSRTLALLDRYAPGKEDDAQVDERVDDLSGAADKGGFVIEAEEGGGDFSRAPDEGPQDLIPLQEHEQDIEPDEHSGEQGGGMGYEFDEVDEQEGSKKPDFGLPEEIEPDHYAPMPEKKSSSKKILIIVVACIMLAGIVIGAYFARQYFGGSGQQAKPATAEAPAAPAAEKPAPPVETEAEQAQPAVPAAPAVPEKAKETPVTAAPVAPEKPAGQEPARSAAPEKPAAQAPAGSADHAKAAQKTGTAPSAAKAAARGTFSVQVGIFETEKNAAALAEKLRQKGYAARVNPDAADPKRPRYRVLVGSFDTRAKAAVQAKAITEKEGGKAFVRQN
ncbi:MAG: hypothetical protein OHK006_18680 [Thermodesulfovibrionales bacterium]